MATVTLVNATSGANGVVVPVPMAGKTYQLIPFFFEIGVTIPNEGAHTAVFEISTGGVIEAFTPPQRFTAAGVVVTDPHTHTFVLSDDGKKLTITAMAHDINAGSKFFTYLIVGSY